MARSAYQPLTRSITSEGLRARSSSTSPRFLTLRRALALGLLLFISALALLYLWQSWQSVYWLNQVEISRAKLSELQAERDRLQLEVAQAFSLQRIEAYASKRLGMIHPPLKYLVLPPASAQPPTPPDKKP